VNHHRCQRIRQEIRLLDDIGQKLDPFISL
jgi:hypothetical protein